MCSFWADECELSSEIHLHTSQKGFLFVIGIIESSPNVEFVVVTKNFLGAVLHIVNRLFCGIDTVTAFFGTSTMQPIFVQVPFAETPVFQLKMLVVFLCILNNFPCSCV